MNQITKQEEQIQNLTNENFSQNENYIFQGETIVKLNQEILKNENQKKISCIDFQISNLTKEIIKNEKVNHVVEINEEIYIEQLCHEKNQIEILKNDILLKNENLQIWNSNSNYLVEKIKFELIEFVNNNISQEIKTVNHSVNF
jgi:hypothetical protein